MTAYFIADLHLSANSPCITRKFEVFLHEYVTKVDSLYILGDLFDFWIGDDVPLPLSFQPAFNQLKALNAQGLNTYFLPGNRDFLIGKKFCETYAFTLIDDFTVIKLNDEPVLLSHGDALCTDDEQLMKFRDKSRTDMWAQNILSKPLWLRNLLGRYARYKSQRHKRRSHHQIMDVNIGAVIDALQKNHCHTLIHGHTHRPAIHNQQSHSRFVVSDWDKTPQVVYFDGNSLTLISLDSL